MSRIYFLPVPPAGAKIAPHRWVQELKSCCASAQGLKLNRDTIDPNTCAWNIFAVTIYASLDGSISYD